MSTNPTPNKVSFQPLSNTTWLRKILLINEAILIICFFLMIGAEILLTTGRVPSYSHFDFENSWVIMCSITIPQLFYTIIGIACYYYLNKKIERTSLMVNLIVLDELAFIGPYIIGIVHFSGIFSPPECGIIISCSLMILIKTVSCVLKIIEVTKKSAVGKNKSDYLR